MLFSSMKNKRQFQTSMKVLYQIALNKVAYQSDLGNKIGSKGISYRSLLRHLESLKKIQCIEIDHLEPSSKKGKEKNTWKVTFIGNLLLIKNIFDEISSLFSIDYFEQIMENDPEMVLLIKKRNEWKKYNEKLSQLDDLAKNQSEVLPLIFGKWQFFEDKKIKNIVIRRLSHTTHYIENSIRRMFSIMDLNEQHHKLKDYLKIQKDDIKDTFKSVGYSEGIDHFSKASENMIKASYDPEVNPLKIEEEARIIINNLVFGLAGMVFGLTGPLLDPVTGEKYLLKLCDDQDIQSYIKNEITNRREIIEKSLKNQLEALDDLEKICKLS